MPRHITIFIMHVKVYTRHQIYACLRANLNNKAGSDRRLIASSEVGFAGQTAPEERLL
jgi:hypothetical protein